MASLFWFWGFLLISPSVSQAQVKLEKFDTFLTFIQYEVRRTPSSSSSPSTRSWFCSGTACSRIANSSSAESKWSLYLLCKEGCLISFSPTYLLLLLIHSCLRTISKNRPSFKAYSQHLGAKRTTTLNYLFQWLSRETRQTRKSMNHIKHYFLMLTTIIWTKTAP